MTGDLESPSLGCTPEGLVKADAGAVAFSLSQADTCLGFLSDAGCDFAGQFAIASACAPTALLLPNTPLGAACTAGTDCLLPDAGPLAYGEAVGGCLVEGQACGGICSAGDALGTSCENGILSADGTTNVDVCGASQGYCGSTFNFDGGTQPLCVSFFAIGTQCYTTSGFPGCGGGTAYCAGDGGSTGLCEPIEPAGSPCNPQLCADAPQQCVCGQLACIPTDGGRNGVCGEVGFQTPCVYGVGTSCGLLFPSNTQPNCVGFEIADGGRGNFCQHQAAGLGSPCDGYADSCPAPYTCDTVSGVCVSPGVLGEPCDPIAGNSCYPSEVLTCLEVQDGGGVCSFEYPPVGAGETCTFTTPCDALDYCQTESLGSDGTCAPVPLLGEPCDPANAYVACGQGFCAADAGVCVPFLPLGAACAFGSDVCGRAGQGVGCLDFGVPDGGLICQCSL